MANVNELDKKIQKLEDEIKSLKADKSALEEEQNPDDVQAAQPKIDELTKQIEDKEKDLTHLKKQKAAAEKPAAEKTFAEKIPSEKMPRVGQTLYHWCYGPVKVLDVATKDKDTFIHCQILDPAGVREPDAAAWLNNPPYEPYKRWMPAALGVWLFDEAEKVVYSPWFDPAQQHKFYD